MIHDSLKLWIKSTKITNYAILNFTGDEFNCSTYDGTEDEAKIRVETPTVVIEGSGEEETTGGKYLSVT